MAAMNIDKGIWKIKRGSVVWLFLFCVSGALTACGQEPGAEDQVVEVIPIELGGNLSEDNAGGTAGASATAEDGMTDASDTMSPAADLEEEGDNIPESDGQIAETGQSGGVETAPRELDAMQELFGADCISEQTFEVQLSEYEQKVYFVPFAPSSENPQFQIQLIQNGQVLAKLGEYVPEGLEGEKFRSLDAVAFADVNFDGDTDILLLETYGDTRFAAVYCGERDEWEGWEGGVRVSFLVQDELSESLSDRVNPLTVSEIFSFLTDGKKNGEFSGYQEAYEAVSQVYDLVSENMEYNLIYFDEDDIPELAVGHDGYWVSLFTYDEGRVYCLMNHWAYGAGGNHGYDYVPGKNSLRNYDADMGDNVFYTTYMAVSGQHTMELVAEIKYENYLDDVNEITGEHCIIYVNGVEVTEDEDIDYDVGDYEPIRTILSRKELLEMLER